VKLFELINSALKVILVKLLPEAASHSAFSVLHPLSSPLIFLRVLIIGKATVLILDGFLKVLTFLVSETLELINSALIATYGIFVGSGRL
jgi:hypothetical protein